MPTAPGCGLPLPFPPLFLSLFLITKIKEPIIPMTAVTTFRLNHKLCSKCLVCRKSCSIAYVSHYGVNLQKKAADASAGAEPSRAVPAARSAPAAPRPGAHGPLQSTSRSKSCLPRGDGGAGTVTRWGQRRCRVGARGFVGDGGVCASPELTCARSAARLSLPGQGWELPPGSASEPNPPCPSPSRRHHHTGGSVPGVLPPGSS